LNTVLLLSGGMDSIAIAHWIRPRLALTVDYGQVCALAETRAAAQVARELAISHSTLAVDLSSMGVGRLAGAAPLSMSPTPEWWPFRNQLLVTLAATHAIKCKADSVVIGTLATDDAHADGSPAFVETLDALLQMQEGGIRLITPALRLDGLELARRSGVPRELLAYAHSCHVSNLPCGRCRGCLKRLDTLSGLGWS